MILLLRKLFIEHVPFTVFESHAAKAVFASRAVYEKSRIDAVFTGATKGKVVALEAINAFVAPLAAVDVEVVHAISGLPYNVSVVAIFVADISPDEVAILTGEREVAVVGVLALNVVDTHARDSVMERLDVVEDGFSIININAVRQRIPLVTPPLVHVVDGERCIGVVHRENFLST